VKAWPSSLFSFKEGTGAVRIRSLLDVKVGRALPASLHQVISLPRGRETSSFGDSYGTEKVGLSSSFFFFPRIGPVFPSLRRRLFLFSSGDALLRLQKSYPFSVSPLRGTATNYPFFFSSPETTTTAWTRIPGQVSPFFLYSRRVMERFPPLFFPTVRRRRFVHTRPTWGRAGPLSHRRTNTGFFPCFFPSESDEHLGSRPNFEHEVGKCK